MHLADGGDGIVSSCGIGVGGYSTIEQIRGHRQHGIIPIASRLSKTKSLADEDGPKPHCCSARATEYCRLWSDATTAPSHCRQPRVRRSVKARQGDIGQCIGSQLDAGARVMYADARECRSQFEHAWIHSTGPAWCAAGGDTRLSRILTLHEFAARQRGSATIAAR